MTFNLTDFQYNSLRSLKGRIDMRVDKVSSPGSLKVKLNEKQLSSPAAAVGTIPVYFTADDAQMGMNVLDISGTGSFYIGEIKVGIER